MLKRFNVLFICSFVILGCSQNGSEKIQNVESEKEEVVERINVVSTKTLDIEISGMSCEMGCGAAIKKDLFATGAVENVNFDFKMGRDINHVEISFDDNKISDSEIKKIISQTNKNQFTLGKANVTEIVQNSSNDNFSSKKVAVEQFASMHSTESFKIKSPNFIDFLLSTLLRK